MTPEIHYIWLVHKASAYSDSVWGLWLRLDGKLRISQNCQLRNYIFVLLWAEISWKMQKWAETSIPIAI